MSLNRNSLIEDLYQQALDLPRDRRAPFLAKACAGDDALQREVLSLIEHNEAAPTGFLAGVPRGDGPKNDPAPLLDPMLGRTIGRYRLLRVIATGGMGTVYEAQQDRPQRTVAVKLIRHGFASGANVRRFLNESDVLGRLSHPGIAQIFEAGIQREANGAVPYFAMEYLPDALSIADYTERNSLSLPERLELFLTACEAVQYAHQRAVIHRDLKPANVLVTPDGRVKVIDFGVARVMEADESIATRTATGQIVGTLRYMSPEQCSSGVHDLDTTTDVYSLGVLLYELLTGAMPYDTTSNSPFDMPRIIRELDPLLPSTFAPNLRGDLETVLLKALEKDPRRRYQSVAALAEDIRRYLRNEPIEARRNSRWYVLVKGLRRHWLMATVTSAFVLLCAGAASWLAVLYSEAATQRSNAQHALSLAERRTYYNAVSLAHSALETGDAQRVVQYLNECPQALRGWEWYYLLRSVDLSRARIDAHARNADCVFAPDGTTIATWSDDGSVRLWDVRSGRMLQEFVGHQGPVRGAVFTPDGTTLISGGDDRTIRLWNLATGSSRIISGADAGRVGCLAVAPDGRHVASSGFDEQVKVWDIEEGRLVKALPAGAPPLALAFSNATGELVSGNADGLLTFWDIHAGAALREIPSDARTMAQLSFSADGTVLAAASWDNAVRVWDLPSETLLHTLDCGTETPLGLAVSPDGRFVAVAAVAVHTWNLTTGREGSLRLGHVGGATSVAYSPDGRTLASGGYDGLVRFWDAPLPREPLVLRGHTDFVRGVAAFPDGRRIASISRDGTIRMWDIAGGAELDHFSSGVLGDQTLALHPNGKVLVSGGLDGVVRVHDLRTHDTLLTIETRQRGVLAVALSPSGREVASTGVDGTCRFWDVSTGTQLGEARPNHQGIRHVTYSRDGTLVATSGYDRTVRLWQRNPLRERFVLVGHEDAVGQTAFSPDGLRLASASNDNTVRIWDTGSGTLLHTLRGHRSAAQSVAFLPDGSRLISGGYDHLINIWDGDSGTLILTLRGHKGGIPWLAVSPDGAWFASAGNDQTVRVWNAAIDREEPEGKHHEP